jgi:CubicO group peptidase (beta-lactamase class C family)
MLRNLLSVVFYFLISNASGYGQLLNSLTATQILRLDSIARQDVPTGAPGIATGIIEKGKVIYQKVYGFANLADSSLITADTRFNIASNGKQFTALAILLLIDEQKLRLSDDIRRYLPGIFSTQSPRITIENLLNHTSGIRDVYDLWSLQGLTWWKNSFNNADVLKLLAKQQELNFKPDSKYLYSNSNYILLASIIEKVTGRSFVAFTNDLFQQLKMPNTSFEDDYANIRGPIAKAYFNFGTWTTYHWVWNVCGDGNIFSTLSDQLRWEQLLQGQGNTTIKWSLLHKSQQLTDHSGVTNYGYGLEFGTYKGLPYKFHEGATGAWKATVIRFADQNVSFVTLTNTGKSTPDKQTRQMADVYFNLKDDASYFVTKPAKSGSYVSEEDIEGIYQTGKSFTFQFEKKDGFLYLKRMGRNDVKLEREASNIFHQTYDPDFKQEFKKNDKGEMEVTAYYTSHAPYTLTKYNVDWTGFKNTALNGKFINRETNVTINIGFAGDRVYDVKIGNQNNTKALLISPTQLLVDNYIIEFGKTKSIMTFLLSGGRIERIRFVRM